MNTRRQNASISAKWKVAIMSPCAGARRGLHAACVWVASALTRRPGSSRSASMAFLFFSATSCSAAPLWIEDSFEDFSDGSLDASGQNLYVSHDGSVRSIARFDLNDDGWIDLLYMNTHDMTTNAPPVLVEVGSDRSISTSPLAFSGAMQVNVEDLNKDGYDDFVFSPNPTGIQNPRLFLTIVYGAEDGWSTQRSSNLLPVNGAGHYYRGNIVLTSVADLNADGWPDIVTLNSEAWLPGQPKGMIVRTYWGSESGYLLTDYEDTGVPGATSMVSGDFNADGARDVALLRSDNTLEILWANSDPDNLFERSQIVIQGAAPNSVKTADVDDDGIIDILLSTNSGDLHVVAGKPGKSFSEQKTIEAFPASHIAVGDLDDDSYPDIVLSFFSMETAGGGELGAASKSSGSAAQILWGSDAGYDKRRSTNLDAEFLKASTLGDFDGDGASDVALAIYQDTASFETESVIYYGNGDRSFTRGSRGVATEGAFCAETVSLAGSGPDLVVYCSSRGGAVGEHVPLQLYWGGESGFSVANSVNIPFRSGNGAVAADFNVDGYVDLLANNSMHAKQTFENDPTAGANIFWGGPDGFDFSDDLSGRTILRVERLATGNTADFNKDGYLDIVLGHYPLKGQDDSVVIYYGSELGFSDDRVTKIATPGWSLGDIVADYDKDGWLDIAVIGGPQDECRIFYGSEEGFNESRRSALRVPWCVSIETADLNKDGWLDLVLGTYQDVVNKHHDLGVTIFWGNAEGYQHWNKMSLPGNTPIGTVVADFDADGYLDIFNPLYHRDLDRENVPMYLFWGGKDGFDPNNRTTLIADSGHDALAADFDRDGKLDLAVMSHTKHDTHHTFSQVFYNDGNRFADPRIEELPTAGPHWTYNRDMGHIYDRSWQQVYVSSIFDWDGGQNALRLEYEAETPDGTSIQFEVRSAHEREGLLDAAWLVVENDGSFEVDRGARFLQYRATFVSDNGDRYPVLGRVAIHF